jgi:hypothetical protein
MDLVAVCTMTIGGTVIMIAITVMVADEGEAAAKDSYRFLERLSCRSGKSERRIIVDRHYSTGFRGMRFAQTR